MSRKNPRWNDPEVQAVDGEGYYPRLRNHYDQCCHCGLIHRLNFYIEDKKGRRIRGASLKIVATQMPRSTAAVRRAFQFQRDQDDDD